MDKPTMLYASPFPPVKSGISDYSVMLVRALSAYFDITLYTEDYEIDEPSMAAYPVLRCGVDTVDFDAYDYLLYNMGNNADFHVYIYEAALAHPGFVIEHDLVLFHFVMGYYRDQKHQLYSSLYSRFGKEDFLAVKDAVKTGIMGNLELASRLPLNTELLRSGNRFLVHSEYTRNQILSTGLLGEDDVCRFSMIAQIEDDPVYVPRKELLRRYGVPEDALLICAFGYVQETKLNRETCHAVRRLAERTGKKLCYVMVGKGDYIDDELTDGLILKTGYTELDEFNSFIHYADVIVNLRYPTMGESSASMLRTLQEGKCCITNNGGWFSELPDDCVTKIALDDVEGNLEKKLEELLLHEELRQEIGERAKRFAQETSGSEAVSRAVRDYLFSHRKS